MQTNRKEKLMNLFEIGENSKIKIYSKDGIGSGFICKINDNQLNIK